jgi:uncharacterized membrane protein HdeD (DUF308 family)
MTPVLRASPDAPLTHDLEHLKGVWWALLLMGLLSILVGMLAIGSTVVATLASVWVFGWLLVAAGVVEVVQAVMVRQWKGFALHLLAAALYLVVGIFLLEDPLQAAKVLTLIMAASFLAGGALRIVTALAMRFASWQWVLLNGAINVVLGIMILNRWPYDALWVIGLFVGIDLLFHGWSCVILALTVKSFRSSATA